MSEIEEKNINVTRRKKNKKIKGKDSKFNILFKTLIFVIFVILIIEAITDTFYIVKPGELSIVLRFGKLNRTLKEGVYFKIPFGIEKNYLINTKEIKRVAFEKDNQGKDILMLTGDLNLVRLSWVLNYNIAEPNKWVFNVIDKENILKEASFATVSKLLANMKMYDVLNNKREDIEEKAIILIKEALDKYDMGINLVSLKILDLNVADNEVEKAFDSINSAIQEMNKSINEGNTIYNSEIPKIKGEAMQILEVAKGFREERINNAEGKVARFLKLVPEYKRDPMNTKVRLYYEAMARILSDKDKIKLIDKNLENLNFYLERG